MCCKVAIIGRPNVGKSSLYNRLIQRRSAIVDSTPGVTRDRQYCVRDFKNVRFVFVDTGGIEKKHSDSDFSALIERQSRYALDEADIVFFLVEVYGVTEDDYSIAELLRKSSKPVILVINKCDNEQLEHSLHEHYTLQIGKSVCVSAIHNRGIEELLTVLYRHVNKPTNVSFVAKTHPRINIAIIGRPNVGKSSLLNTILGNQRSLVSEISGTTRDAVEESVVHKDYELRFIDTAGMRRKSRVHEDLEYYSVHRAIRSIRKADIVLHLIDSLENISTQDKKIAALTVKYGKAMIIVINKWELVKGVEDFEEYVDKIRFHFAAAKHIPILSISAKTGLRVHRLIDKIIALSHEAVKNISTPQLNKFITQLQAHKQFPIKKNQLKVYYATQITNNPTTFLFFVNNAKLWNNNYSSYFSNKLREHFNFSGVPIIIKVKKAINVSELTT